MVFACFLAFVFSSKTYLTNIVFLIIQVNREVYSQVFIVLQVIIGMLMYLIVNDEDEG